MSMSSGTRLGPYEMLSPLGAGGMGEVYRARDPKLGRDVGCDFNGANLLGGPGDPSLPEQRSRPSSHTQYYDVSPDGRFVVQNWFAEFKRR
jgi:serine/threonine protein kinase